MERKYYVMALTEIDDNLDLGWPVYLEPKTKASAQLSIDWQIAGGESVADFVVAEADPDLPGVMFYTYDGMRRPVLVGMGPHTDKAYGDFLMSIWADCVGEAA